MKHSARALLFVLIVLIAGPAAAAMLSVAPVSLEISAPRTNAKLNLENRGEEPVTVQIRVFRWENKNGKDSLTPTSSVVASPPMAMLKPHGKYTVRIVRVAQAPVTSEESYRLLVDQLPKLVKQSGSRVSFLIRQSIPVFFTTAETQRAALAWSARIEGHTRKNDLIATVQTSDGTGSGTIAANGAVVVADGEVFLSRHIGDAFSIVDVGHPDIEVFSQNRPVGKTGRNGKILITDVVPFHKNKVAIETDGLPVDTEIIETEAETVAARNSGSIVSFRVATNIQAAVVVFKLSDGAFVPAGSIARVNGRDEAFVVGYDGQAYLTGLNSENIAVVEHPGGSCTSQFGYVPRADSQVFIDGVACQ